MITKTRIDPDAEVAPSPLPVRIAKAKVVTKGQNPAVQPPEAAEAAEEDEAGPSEDRSARFKRVASSRVKSVLKQIRLLGNCSNRSAYEFTEPQVERILEVLRKAVEDLGVSFNPVKNDSEDFHFE